MGQYAVGACLRFFYGCKIVAYDQQFYNAKFEEIDVVGVNPSQNTVYICEVIVQLDGLKLGPDNRTTLQNLRKRFEKMKYYGEKFFANFNKQYMFWSPYVPKGALTDGLSKLHVELSINISFKVNKFFREDIVRLMEKARSSTSDYGEPFLRALQIVYHKREK